MCFKLAPKQIVKWRLARPCLPFSNIALRETMIHHAYRNLRRAPSVPFCFWFQCFLVILKNRVLRSEKYRYKLISKTKLITSHISPHWVCFKSSLWFDRRVRAVSILPFQARDFKLSVPVLPSRPLPFSVLSISVALFSISVSLSHALWWPRLQNVMIFLIVYLSLCALP